MDELISKQDLLDEISELPLDWEYGQAVSDIYDIIKKHPAVDAVEVVRCKDCRYFTPKVDGTVGFCKCGEVVGYHPMMRVAMNFCSYGERKEENADD